MAKVTINGTELEVADGSNLVDAAEANGIEIPHYCYHPGLSIAGQCRMCLVEVEGNPKLQIACNMKCSDGLKVTTNNPKVTAAVKSSLEMHLINHPIDCPICDQAGECGLQDYYMKHGKYDSQMEEQKVNKPKVVDLGDDIVLDKERCILCSRCVRFTQEISKTHEFGIFNRGDRSVIGTFEDKPLSGNYQLNTVDICPVGALTSKDFRFEQRVWFLDETESVCGGCSKGCNVYVHHKSGRHIYRLKPRENQAVNSFWMCDKGRYTYKDSNYDKRLTNSKLGGIELPFEEAMMNWASDLKILRATERMDEVGVFLTPHQTNEELSEIFDSFRGVFQISKFFSEDIENFVKNDRPVDDFLLRSDPYPNSKGFLNAVSSLKLKLGGLEDLVQAVQKETLSQIILIVPEVDRMVSLLAELSQSIRPSQFVVLLTPHRVVSELFPSALCIPTLSHYEKVGTMTNHAGVTQTLSSGFKMFKQTHSIPDVLKSLREGQLHTEVRSNRQGRGAAL